MSGLDVSPEDEQRRFNEQLAHNSRVLTAEGLLQKAVRSIIEDGSLDHMLEAEREPYLVQSRPIIYRSYWDIYDPWASRENTYTISLFHAGPDDKLSRLWSEGS